MSFSVFQGTVFIFVFYFKSKILIYLVRKLFVIKRGEKEQKIVSSCICNVRLLIVRSNEKKTTVSV